MEFADCRHCSAYNSYLLHSRYCTYDIFIISRYVNSGSYSGEIKQLVDTKKKSSITVFHAVQQK